MKKILILATAVFAFNTANAQELTSKKGELILPQKGDWSIGIDATPFLNYMGNFFGKSTANNALVGGFTGYGAGQTIVGKYFVDEKTAYRAILRIGVFNNKQKRDVAEFADPGTLPTNAIATASEPVFDQYNSSTRNIAIGAGYEKRKGTTRLQGIYGGEFYVWGGNRKEKYKYGNELTQTDNTVTAFDENLDVNEATYVSNFGSNIKNSLPGYSNVSGARALNVKTNGELGIGLRAFIGVEYFVLPRMSIGGEFGWGIGYVISTKDKATYEAEGTGTAVGSVQELKTVEVIDKVNGGSAFMLDTDRNAVNSSAYNLLGGSGNIRLNFYF